MGKIYERVNWEDHPSTSTPINALNLNKMDEGIDKLDDKIVGLNNIIEQTKEGQFVFPNGLKICWGQDTLEYGNEHVAHGTIYFPFYYQKPPIVITSKLLLNHNAANGWVDIQTTCSQRSISTGGFSAGIYNSAGSFNQEEENYKWFAVSWIAIGY